jgi:ribosomal-protein-alanine N-acetyltransferase
MAKVEGDRTRDRDMVVHMVAMRRRHLRSVLRIESQVYPRPWSLSLFVSELALRNSRAYWVARVDGNVVGYCGLMVSVDDGHVTTLAVDPAWHRRTIGTRLLLTLAREAIHRGATGLTLEVRMGNRGAQELYRRFGFRPAGVRKNYYVETNEDALVMWADDVTAPAYASRLAEIESLLPGTTLVEEPRS